MDVLFTSDWHLRHDTPVCRQDDFLRTQERKLAFITQLAQEHDVPIVRAGDLFHKARPPYALTSWAMDHVPAGFDIPGNHDLPEHSLDRFDESALGILAKNTTQVHTEAHLDLLVSPRALFYFLPFGVKEVETYEHNRDRTVVVLHEFIWYGVRPFPGCRARNAQKLLKDYPFADLIVCGDNHTPFIYKKGPRMVLNCGSISRQTAAEKDHKPRVWLWDASTNTVKPVYIPISRNAVSRKHLEKIEERDGRIEAFVTKLSDDYNVSLNFRDNMKNFLAENEVPAAVEKAIWVALD